MPGPGSKRMKPNGLVAAASIDLPDVDVHPVAEHGELVDERDVDRAEDVLEQLRHLGRIGRRDQHARRRRPARRAASRGRAQAGVSPPTIFTVLRSVKSERPGSTRSGEIGDVEVAARRQPRLLEQRHEPLARRARVGRRLEHDELVPAAARARARWRRRRPGRGPAGGSRSGVWARRSRSPRPRVELVVVGRRASAGRRETSSASSAGARPRRSCRRRGSARCGGDRRRAR